MEINRDSIYIGEIFKNEFLSYRCIRKILFTADFNNNKGIDLINDGTAYRFFYDKKRHFYYIDQCFELDQLLANLGYPEVLNDQYINKLINEDFYKVVIESGVYHQLQEIIGESCFNIDFYKNNINFAMSDFKIKDEEKEEQPKRKIFKRGNK